MSEQTPGMAAALESAFEKACTEREAKEAAQLAADSVPTDNIVVLRERATRHATEAIDGYWGHFGDMQKELTERVITPLLNTVTRIAAERDKARAVALTEAIETARSEVLREAADALEARVADVDVDTSTTWAGMDAAYLRHLAASSTRTAGDEQPEKPSRFTAVPAQVDDYLRRNFTEEVVLNYQWTIGDLAVEEAAKDIRMETASLKAHGVLEPDKDWAASAAANHIDPAKGGGHYPSVLLCGKHNGFGPCPGAPRCTPRDAAKEVQS